jgi:hypothetical protein
VELTMQYPPDGFSCGKETLHPKTAALVDRFAAALKEKLAAAEEKYGYSDGWATDDWMGECRKELRKHVAKGDPLDVAAYCAFLWHHGEATTGPCPQPDYCNETGSCANGCDDRMPRLTDQDVADCLGRSFDAAGEYPAQHLRTRGSPGGSSLGPREVN